MNCLSLGLMAERLDSKETVKIEEVVVSHMFEIAATGRPPAHSKQSSHAAAAPVIPHRCFWFMKYWNQRKPRSDELFAA